MKVTTYPLLLFLIAACTSNTQGNSEKPAQDLGQEQQTTDSLAAELNTQVALDFINSYVENENKMNDRKEIREWTKTSELVTENFRSELIKLVTEAWEGQPEYGLSYDPILDAQDYPDEGFELTEFDTTTGLVTVNGKDWKDFTLNIKLISENGRTLVDGCGSINLPDELRAKR